MLQPKLRQRTWRSPQIDEWHLLDLLATDAACWAFRIRRSYSPAEHKPQIHFTQTLPRSWERDPIAVICSARPSMFHQLAEAIHSTRRRGILVPIVVWSETVESAIDSVLMEAGATFAVHQRDEISVIVKRLRVCKSRLDSANRNSTSTKGS